MPYVAVIGPGRLGPDDPLLDAAYEAGAALARGGAVVVTGGLDGVMAAASRGAVEAGGRTLGVLPGASRSGANPWSTLSLPTGLGEARNALVVRAADAVLVVGGSWGTLSEVALACRTGRPVFSVAGWSVRDAAGSPVDGAAAAMPDAAAAAEAALTAARNRSG